MKKGNENGKMYRNCGKVILFIVGFISIPLFFCVTFNSGEQSTLMEVISCNMSAGDWFSFWITYLAAISSAAVAICSFQLTRRIEEIQLKRQFEEERVKFRIVQIQETYEPIGLKITFPLEILSINNVKITQASITFGGGERLEYLNGDISLQGSSFYLTQPSEIDRSCKDAWSIWYNYQSKRTTKYRDAELSISCRYPATVLGDREKEQLVCSRAKVSIKLDKNGMEYFDISDWTVF